MDFVGPLHRLAQGFTYMLIIIDYALRCPRSYHSRACRFKAEPRTCSAFSQGYASLERF